MKVFVQAILLAFMTTGCTHLSQESLALADHSVTFTQVQQAPQSYIGKTVIFGGRIAAATKIPEGAVLQIIQMDLDNEYIPKEFSPSDGRFLATTPLEADVSNMRPGDLITVIGEVKGKKTGRGDDADDDIFPVVAIREIRRWNTPESRPASLESNYDPYYSGYPADPYKYRPPGTVLKKY